MRMQAALLGDKIEFRDGKLHLNGVTNDLVRHILKEYEIPEPLKGLEQYQEVNFGGKAPTDRISECDFIDCGSLDVREVSCRD